MSVYVEAEDMVAVALPSGGNFPVHLEEVDYFTERVDQYMKHNRFVNISDLQDVDRMMILELMVYRWGQWLSRQRDYWAQPIDADQLQKQVKEYSAELRQLKKLLGIDKVARDRQRGEDSVSAYIENLKIRAKEFGVMRERQLAKALELFHDLQALVTLWRNCDEVERREQHIELEDLVDWIETIAIPEFQEIDAYFREHQQKLWVRSQ